MPVCPQCDNRQFSNKEALLQHMRSSSAWHPFCTQCDRRFVSQTAYDAHMAAKHPPTFDCTVCNRPYHAPFALDDHYRGSTAHPNCTKCGRGFRDLAACEEHRLAEHPKAACASCGGKVFYEDELTQHYWDSPNHPKCQTCKTGCKDEAAYVEHMSSAHPEQHCSSCGASFETADALQAHLWASPSHPKCDRCEIGFADSEAKKLHMEGVHTPNTVPTFSANTQQTEASPEPVASVDRSLLREANPLPQPSIQQKSDGTVYSSTGFTPLSPRHPMQSLIVGERRINSPDLRLDLGFSSPIIDAKPPFSPAVGAVLPRPGVKIEELWNSTENVQISPTRIPQLAASAHGASNGISNGHGMRPYVSRFGYYTYPPSTVTAAPPALPAAASAWLDTPARNEPLRVRETRVSPPRADQFHPRLYPGSVRAASLGRPSLLSEAAFPPPAGTPGARVRPSGPASVGGASVFGYAYGYTAHGHTYAASANGYAAGGANGHGHAYAASVSYAGGSGGGGAQAPCARAASAEGVDWEDLMSASPPALRNSSVSVMDSELEPESGMAAAASEAANGNEDSNRWLSQPPRLQPPAPATAHSPSLATASSPASSALGHSPLGSGSAAYEMFSGLQEDAEMETRPTTASSTPSAGLLRVPTPFGAGIQLRVDNGYDGYECDSPLRAPDLSSPTDVRSLPAMSPLAGTPVDGPCDDIPAARQPLPASPTEAEAPSPLTVVVDLPTAAPRSPPPASASPSAWSYTTSPVREAVHRVVETEVAAWGEAAREAEAEAQADAQRAAEELEDEARAEEILQEALREAAQRSAGLGADMGAELDLGTDVDAEAVSEYLDAVLETAPASPATAVAPERERERGAADGAPKTSPGPLHCRVCLADTCDDITASMCGHIFCNRCITDAVIKTSRCPVCMTPTLLYCLFRLDLAA